LNRVAFLQARRRAARPGHVGAGSAGHILAPFGIRRAIC